MTKEFKKITIGNETRYVIESMTAGATGAGAIATAPGRLGELQKRLQELKDKVPQKPRQGPLRPQTGAGVHKNKKKDQQRGIEKHKGQSVYQEEFNGEYDDEAGMAESNLHTLARAVKGLMDTIDHNDNLPEWCQEKIAKAEMMLVSVWDYLLSQKEQGIDPEQDMEEGYWQDALKNAEADREARKGKPFEKNPASHDKQGVYKGDKDLAGNPVPQRRQQGVAEAENQELSLQQLATISDEVLDKAYGYGRSRPGNTFGWQANLKSAEYAKQMIDRGVTDIEAISDAIHKGWNVTARAFVQNPDQFDDTEKLRQAGKLEAKLQQRAKLMKINYAQLDNEEQEKDRVVARALLQAIKGEQGVAEGINVQQGKVYNKKDRLMGTWDGRKFTMNPDVEAFLNYEVGPEVVAHTKDMYQSELSKQGVAEGKIKGADGKACWKGKRYAGTKNGKDICIPVGETDQYMTDLSEKLNSVISEKAPPGDKYERMVKHIKKGYAKDGKLTDVEKSKAYGAAWKAKNQKKK